MSLRHVGYRQIRKFFSARVFRRMWVSLEFSESDQAVFSRRNFNTHWLRTQRIIFIHVQWVLVHAHQISTWVNILTLLKELVLVLSCRPHWRCYLKDRIAHHHFGTVVSVLATKDCRTFRDRFLAICGFPRDGNYETISLQLPRISRMLVVGYGSSALDVETIARFYSYPQTSARFVAHRGLWVMNRWLSRNVDVGTHGIQRFSCRLVQGPKLSVSNAMCWIPWVPTSTIPVVICHDPQATMRNESRARLRVWVKEGYSLTSKASSHTKTSIRRTPGYCSEIVS